MSFRDSLKWTLLFLIVPIVALAQQTPARNLKQYCLSSYEKNGVCPPQTCRFECVEGTFAQGCPLTCEPKNCLELSVHDCPADSCQIMDGCQPGQKICYPKMTEDLSECGDLAYMGDKQCCNGFMKRCGVEFFDGSCDMLGVKTTSSIPMCLPCGNGICNQFENRCNCPEDCGGIT